MEGWGGIEDFKISEQRFYNNSKSDTKRKKIYLSEKKRARVMLSAAIERY